MMTEPRKRITRGDVSSAVFRYFMERPGITVHVQDVVEATGFTKNQVQNCVLNLRRRSDQLVRDLSVVLSGQAWLYRPSANGQTAAASVTATPERMPARPAPIAKSRPAAQDRPALYEEVYSDPSKGVLLLKSEAGELFTASRYSV